MVLSYFLPFPHPEASGGGVSESPLPSATQPPPSSSQSSQSQEQLKQMEAADVPKKLFNPFCSVDGMQLSIHCHINSVKTLVCVPGQVPKDRECIYIQLVCLSCDCHVDIM